jgi:hypothetical protein
MGFLNWFKKPKYDRSKEEVDKIIEKAVIPLHARKTASPAARKPRVLPERKPVVVIPSEKNVFFVENSFKMTDLFILNGYVRSGRIRRNMRTVFNGEKLRIAGVQSNFKKAIQLLQGQRGSIEITTKTGFNLPDNTELEFRFNSKTKRKSRRFKPAKPRIPKPLKPKPGLAAIPDVDAMSEDIAREEKGEIRSEIP